MTKEELLITELRKENIELRDTLLNLRAEFTLLTKRYQDLVEHEETEAENTSDDTN